MMPKISRLTSQFVFAKLVGQVSRFRKLEIPIPSFCGHGMKISRFRKSRETRNLEFSGSWDKPRVNLCPPPTGNKENFAQFAHVRILILYTTFQTGQRARRQLNLATDLLRIINFRQLYQRSVPLTPYDRNEGNHNLDCDYTSRAGHQFPMLWILDH